MLFILDIIFTIIAGLVTVFLICRACYIIGFQKGCLRGVNECQKIANNIFDTLKHENELGDNDEK